ncbi:MAG: recombination protein RecO [Campylobacter sp.]|nr:recombination protein RecO [Campylobacter sp.]
MQGYILKITKVRDEDLIVEILTPKNLIKAYRFYGARHSKITQGYKLDFELNDSIKFLPNLVNTMHLGFKWLLDRDRLFYWQSFTRMMHAHLKELEDVDSIYFEVLDECANKLDKQNPKRLFLEGYVKILKAEGRLPNLNYCFLCDNQILDSKITLARAFLPAHTKCMNGKNFEFTKVNEFLKSSKTLNLEDSEVDELYQILTLGF